MVITNSWVEISKSALVNNIGIFKKIIGPKVRLMAVVKSNAYGHGLIETAMICDKQKEVDMICTVNLAEALYLRKSGIKKPLLALSYYNLDKEQIKEALLRNISLVVYDESQFEYLNRLAGNLMKKAKVHFKVDTGTSRLGVSADNSFKSIKSLIRCKNLKLMGIFTHYAASEEMNQSFTIKQTKIFKELIEKLEENNISVPIKHSACSAAALINSDYHFNAIRLGISIYGLWSLENGNKLRAKYNLKPALSWKTKVIQIKEIDKGGTIGYGREYRLKKKTKIAVLPVGYWEGYDRKLSGKGEVLIKGKRCKILGRVCMNLIMVDITAKNVKVGDEVVLIGKQGREVIAADDLAEKIGTINYEVVTRINPLLKRKVVL